MAKKKQTKKKETIQNTAYTPHPKQTTYGMHQVITEAANNPPLTQGQPRSPFTFPIRQPGWFPDGVDDCCGAEQSVFAEEMIRVEPKTGTPFPVETPISKPAQDTNHWILGDPLPEDDTPGSFNHLLHELARMSRNYNATLYRLRRLHFASRYSGKSQPPPNPDDPGDAPGDVDTSDPGFGNRVACAEADWDWANKKLNNLLDRQDTQETVGGITLVGVDMITVNNYIVSMRVVANPTNLRKKSGQMHLEEVGGSSSAHVSLCSCFSSCP